jgi:hypothetical protein
MGCEKISMADDSEMKNYARDRIFDERTTDTVSWNLEELVNDGRIFVSNKKALRVT